jgi:hypothetical protein
MSTEIFLPKIELSTYEPSKFNNDLIKTTIVEHFKETGESPLETLVRMDAISQLFDAVRSELRDLVVDELAKHPNGKTEVLGSEVSKIESGIKYIYDQDYTWQKLNEEVEAKKYSLKEREKMLRTINSAMVDPETGEMVHPAPKISTTTFKISLKK